MENCAPLTATIYNTNIGKNPEVILCISYRIKPHHMKYSLSHDWEGDS